MKMLQKINAYECEGIKIKYSEVLAIDCAAYIKSKLTRRELLEQLTEECCELGQAATKLIRAEGLSNNPTPISKEEAKKKFTEEQLDVISILWLLTDSKMYEHIRYYPKYVRWAIRLGYQLPKGYAIDISRHQKDVK